MWHHNNRSGVCHPFIAIPVHRQRSLTRFVCICTPEAGNTFFNYCMYNFVDACRLFFALALFCFVLSYVCTCFGRLLHMDTGELAPPVQRWPLLQPCEGHHRGAPGGPLPGKQRGGDGVCLDKNKLHGARLFIRLVVICKKKCRVIP